MRVPWTAMRSNQSILGDQSWVFIGGTDVEVKTGTTEDKMFGWHHRLNGQGIGWTLGVGDGQGDLAWCAAVHGVTKSQKRLRLN